MYPQYVRSPQYNSEYRDTQRPSLFAKLQSSSIRKADPMPLVLESVKARAAITCKLDSCVLCLWWSPYGLAVGCENGSVALVWGTDEIAVLGQHRKAVGCSAGAKDVFVTGCHAGEIIVWRLSCLMNSSKLPASTGWIRCLALTQDCENLFSGSDENFVRMWSLQTHTELRRLENHSSAVCCLLLARDEKSLFSGSFDSTVKVWNAVDGTLEATFTSHDIDISSLAITQNGRFLVSASQDTNIVVWDLHCRERKAILAGHSSVVWCVTATADSQFLLSASADKTVKLWTLRNMQLVTTFTGHNKEVNSVLVTPDDRFAISAASDGFIKVWSLEDYKEVVTMFAHVNWITSLVLSRDGSRVFSGAKDSYVKQWSLDEFQEVRDLYCHSAAVTATTISADSNFVLSASADCTLRLYDLSQSTESVIFRGHKNWVTCVALSRDCRLAVSGSDDSEVRVWSLNSPCELHTFSDHSQGVNAIALTSDDRYAISVSSDQSVRVWDLLTRKCRAILLGHKDSVVCLAVPCAGDSVLTGSWDRTIKLWSLKNFTELRTFQCHSSQLMDLRLHADRCRFLSRSSNGQVCVWNIDCSMALVNIDNKNEFITCAVFSNDGKYLLSGTQDRNIYVRSVDPFVVLTVLVGQQAPCHLQLTPDSSHLISVRDDSSVLVWNLDYMHEVGHYRFDCGRVNDFAVAADGKRLILGTEDGSVKMINMSGSVATLWDLPKAPVATTLSESGRNSVFAMCIDDLKKGLPVHPAAAALAVAPYFFNGLHVCCYYNRSDCLKQLLAAGVHIIRGALGSPFSVALQQNSRRCVDIMLEHLIHYHESSWCAIQAITEDIPGIISFNSPHTMSFLESIFHISTQPHLPYFITPRVRLPQVIATPYWYVQTDSFHDPQSALPQEVVEFLVTDFRWDFSCGSQKSLNLLNSLEECRHKSVLSTPLVSTLIHWKWNYLMPLTVSLTIVYVSLMLFLMMIVFNNKDAEVIKWAFFGLNLLLLLYECVQCYVDTVGYWKDPWNYLDWARSTVCAMWVLFLHGNQYVDLLTVSMCFFRGFTYFRTFKMTRMFVRLTLEVVKEMYTFFIILTYSTIAFGMMYAVLVPDRIDTPLKAWLAAYELLMGSYSTEGFGGLQWFCFTFASLVNVIIMLNLLIAVLGDAYEQAQMSAKENDLLEMLRIIIEYESMLFWRRSIKPPTVLVLCHATDSPQVEDYWEGKLMEITKAVGQKIEASEAVISRRSTGSPRTLDALSDQLMNNTNRLSHLTAQVSTVTKSAQSAQAQFRSHIHSRLNALEVQASEVEAKLDAMIECLSNSVD